jgi:hypothetical protein
MPTRVLTEEPIKKRKVNSVEDKPPKKYTKTIKQEIKKEPIDFSDDDINDDDVMDIEDADKTAKINPKKRIIKTKKIKKVLKTEKDGKEKPKQKKKKKLNPPVNVAIAANVNIENTNTPAKIPSTNSENLPKSTKKTPKIKEKKPREKKPQLVKGIKKPTEKPEGTNGTTKNANESDSDSTVDGSDAYETCGVTHCQRPSGKIFKNFHNNFKFIKFFYSIESVQDWILCDGGCEVWYHMVCVGLKIKEVKPDMEFICNNCKSSKKDAQK